MQRIYSRFFILTLILFALAITLNAYWGGGFGFGTAAFQNTEKDTIAASQPSMMTTPLNAITSFDAAAIANHISGTVLLPTIDHKCAADVTGNGAISSNDSALIARYVTSLGPPYGSTGTVAPVPCHANFPTTIPISKGDVTGTAPVITGGVAGTVAVSLPAVSSGVGVVIVPITVGDVTNMDISSFDFQVTYDPTVVTPAATPYVQSGTISTAMSITANASIPGHLIVSGFKWSPLTGAGTLLSLKFNVIGSIGQSTALTFEDYTTSSDSRAHQGYLFNEGTPSAATTNGSITVTNAATATATATPTIATSASATATPTGTPGQVPVQVSLPNVSAGEGTVIAIPISTGNMNGLGACCYDLDVTFDPAVLQPASPAFDGSGTLSNGMNVSANSNISGRVIVSAYSGSPFQLTGSGTLLNLKFTVVGTAGQSTAVRFENYTDPFNNFHPGFNYNEGTPASTTTNGSVTVAGPGVYGRVTYGNSIGAPAERSVPNVIVNSADGSPVVGTTSDASGQYSLTGFGAGAYTIMAVKGSQVNGINSFDAAKIAQKVLGLTQLTANQMIVADVSGNGSVSSFDAGLVAAYVAGTGASGSTGNWKMLPESRTYASVAGAISGEDYSALLMGEVSGNWTTPGSRPARGPVRSVSVSVPNLASAPNGDIVVPINIQGARDKGIVSYEFDLKYDPSVIQPMKNPVDAAGTSSRGLSIVTNASEPGLLRVVVYGALPIDKDGVLLKLGFTPVGKPGLVSPISFERIMFNEGEPGVSTTGGQVELF